MEVGKAVRCKDLANRTSFVDGGGRVQYGLFGDQLWASLLDERGQGHYCIVWKKNVAADGGACFVVSAVLMRALSLVCGSLFLFLGVGRQRESCGEENELAMGT